jgi:hypothetical protein
LAQLGDLITQFRDSNGSHLMPVLVVLTKFFGIIAGYFLAQTSLDSHSESSKELLINNYNK